MKFFVDVDSTITFNKHPGKHVSHVIHVIMTYGSVCRRGGPVLPILHICAIHTYSYGHCRKVVLVKRLFLGLEAGAHMAYNFLLWLGKKNLRQTHSVCAAIFVLQGLKVGTRSVIFFRFLCLLCSLNHPPISFAILYRRKDGSYS